MTLAIMPRSTAMPTIVDRKTLGDAVGHFDRQRIAPFGDDPAAMDDEPGRIAAVLDRPDRVAERLAPEILIVVLHQIPRRLGLAGDGELDRPGQALRIGTGLGRGQALPGRLGGNNARSWLSFGRGAVGTIETEGCVEIKSKRPGHGIFTRRR